MTSIVLRSILDIASYHGHIYYDPVRTRHQAETLRDAVAERFLVRIGRWHDQPVGPHTQAMFQIAFETSLFPRIVPWLMLNHRGLSILVHPSTTNPRQDHLFDAIWIGAPLPILGDRLASYQSQPDAAGDPNTTPTLNA